MRVTTEYGLRVRSTGQLVHIHLEDVGEYDERAYLTLDEDEPLFTLPRKDALIDVLIYNPPPICSESRRPNWGALNASDLEPVEIKTTVEVSPVPVRLPLMFRAIETREVPATIARRRVGEDVPESDRYVFVVAPLPEGATEADVKDRVGEVACFGDPLNQRLLLGIGPVPAEYGPVLNGRPGVALICKPM